MARAGVVGLVGTVVTRVRGGDVPGEVHLVVAGSRELFTAYSPHSVDVGRRVLVVHERPGVRQVDVEPWEVPALVEEEA